jgi:hypothetical protein
MRRVSSLTVQSQVEKSHKSRLVRNYYNDDPPNFPFSVSSFFMRLMRVLCTTLSFCLHLCRYQFQNPANKTPTVGPERERFNVNGFVMTNKAIGAVLGAVAACIMVVIVCVVCRNCRRQSPTEQCPDTTTDEPRSRTSAAAPNSALSHRSVELPAVGKPQCDC